jgi:hypothetical protein
VRREGNQHEELYLLPTSWWLFSWLPRDDNVPLNYWFTFTGLRSVVSQKTELFIDPVERSSNFGTDVEFYEKF